MNANYLRINFARTSIESRGGKKRIVTINIIYNFKMSNCVYQIETLIGVKLIFYFNNMRRLSLLLPPLVPFNNSKNRNYKYLIKKKNYNNPRADE